MRADVTSTSWIAPRYWRIVPIAVACAALAFAANVRPAEAVILPAVTIDGPSEDIVGFGGVAMADDGTGGVVYLKRVQGVAHVFVARYAEGRWQAPIRVDAQSLSAPAGRVSGLQTAASSSSCGRLRFATESGHPVDELLSSTLGARSFELWRADDHRPGHPGGNRHEPVACDELDRPGGRRLPRRQQRRRPALEHLVCCKPEMSPRKCERRISVANLVGPRHDQPQPGNRHAPADGANAPRMAIGPTGNGIVVWQEPDIDGIARIWARRLFGATLDYVLPVTATSLGSSAIGDDADAPSVSISRLGEAEVAYRQVAGPGSPLPGPRIFLNTLPDGEASSGAEFAGAAIVDSGVSRGEHGVHRAAEYRLRRKAGSPPVV